MSSEPSDATSPQSIVDQTEVTGRISSPPVQVAHEAADEKDLPLLKRGEVLGRYLILDLLGAGGMGEVYAAVDPELDRKVAIKLVRARAGGNTSGTGQALLVREAQAMAQLSHPNVMTIYDVGTTAGGRVFLAMEFVAGKTLRQWMKRTPQPWAKVVPVMLAAGQGIAAAHKAGMVHRDFKPDNVMVGNDGRVLAFDFGLAKAVRNERSAQASIDAIPNDVSTVDTVEGTLAYMAPEQYRGAPASELTDQYSFAVTLYECLCGTRPFGVLEPAQLVVKATTEEPAIPSDLPIPRWLRTVVLRGLSKDPAARFPSMGAMLAALSADPAPIRKRRSLLALAAVGLLISTWGWAKSQDSAHELCRGGERKLKGVWDNDVQRNVRNALSGVSTIAWPRVSKALDGYAQSWVAMHQDACEATQIRKEQSEDDLSLRMDCLSMKLKSFKALTSVISKVSTQSDAAHALQAAIGLGDMQDCADLALLRAPVRPPKDAATRARVESLREQLADVTALLAVDQVKEGIPKARALVEASRSVDYAPLTAAALYELGRAQFLTGDPQGEDTGLEALTLALRSKDDVVAVKAATMMTEVTGEISKRPLDARKWYAIGQSILHRLETNRRLYCPLARAGGAIEWRSGQMERAKQIFAEAEPVCRPLVQDDPVEVSTLLAHSGFVLAEMGNYAEAEVKIREGLRIHREYIGPRSRGVAMQLNNLGWVVKFTGRYDEALKDVDESIVLYTETMGEDHRELINPLDEKGNILLYLGRPEEAIPVLERAIRIQRLVDADSANICSSLTNVGKAYLLTDRAAEAAKVLERSLVLIEQSGTAAESIQARTRFSLAQALTKTSGIDARVRSLVKSARDEYAKATGKEKELEEIDGWVRTVLKIDRL